MGKQEPIKYVILIGLVLALSCSTVQAVGLGASPGNINVPDALKGAEYERTFTAFNTADEDGDFELNATGPGSEWITFYKAEDPETPVTIIHIKGHDQQRILLKIKIAEDAANMEYTPTIYVQSVPPKLEGTEGAVAQAVLRIPVKATIQVTGTQILKGTVKSITTTDTEIDYPLKVKVLFQNEGNVVAKPKIAVAMKKDGKLVDSIVHDETGIKPDCEDTITVLRNTTGRETGDYTADVDVSLGGEVLTTKSLPFKILPFGSLTRQGELTSLTTEGDPLVGRVIKILADFKNTGKIDSRATFKGEVYRDDEFVDIIESDEMIVEVGETSRLTSYYKILSSGKYEVKGCVLYEGKETGTKEISFDVASTKSKGLFGIPGFSGLGLVLIITIIYIITRRFKI
jgi:hypothetical protein